MQPKKILLSGVKPTGRPHIGNYFGAMKQFVDYQNEFDSYIFIANFHALTGTTSPKTLQEDTLDVAIDYLALGLDPSKITLFAQSDVPEVAELAWIFECLSTMPYLMRAHAFKDAEAKNKEINVGVFNYPLLMAADILIQEADVVPVGQDQRQHIEISRDMADKFNASFGEIFKRPQELIRKEVAVVPGTDGQKMSKSYKNTIGLFATDEEIRKAAMSIVTDSSGDTPTNVYEIHKLFRPAAELSNLYEDKKGKYKDLKGALITDISGFITPLRERREHIAADKDAVREILRKGGEKARARAKLQIAKVRAAVGLVY
ncbi:MAG: tryptophan--tRNA ligase [Candidatus Taylorbacteria bacterium RIFCSPLOWO2_01_FULL_45_15b]|uniref:Tryptophan--tRNA ligase n=1 Tax=Candidatus Taylorbacteria bacterium RIFCSPLOWO2_01_FULL_45_15b TaxID=1802319 RepID=A0A1G2NCC2_9BACT|nr:MAG: tryptophan--tRNA ligase [Candidatus Taylorbacteria bacterium RIFCSPLOWO2_01_FULL_45_15b]